MTGPELLSSLGELFGAKVQEQIEFRGEITFVIAASDLREVAKFCQEELSFDYLLDITSVDNFGIEPRFEVVYELYSMTLSVHLRLKLRVSEDASTIDTVSDIWPTANWHGHGEVGFSGAGRPDPKDDVVFLDRFDIIPLPQSARDDRRLAGRGHNLGRDEIAKVVCARFVHRAQGVVELVPLDISAPLPGAFELGKNALGFGHLGGLPLQLDPAFARSDFHSQRFLEVLDQLQVVGVERLHCAGVLELERARFSHLAAGASSAARIRRRREECQPAGSG